MGDVIQESAQIAYTFVRSNSLALFGKENAFENRDLHVHFPAGATPKDGPRYLFLNSAGVTIATALISLLINVPVDPLTAMTGEITLRGLVLPVGGIKEKILAAHRAGIKRVIIPKKNEKDLIDVPRSVLNQVRVVCCAHIEDYLLEIGLIAKQFQAHL